MAATDNINTGGYGLSLMKDGEEKLKPMTKKYVALIRKEEDTEFWVDIPDLPGCVSNGESIEKAKMHFREALEMHMEAMQEDNLALPEPRSRDEVMSAEEDPFVADYFIEIEPINEQ